MNRRGRASWARADAHSVRQEAGVADQSDECKNGNERCPDENGLPCLDCLLDGMADADREVATDGGDEVER